MASAYDFAFKTIKGAPYPLAALKGRPLLVVNTASKCGFTPQYKGLEAVWQGYRERGLVVIGVPCNQFGGQEPATEDVIAGFCEVNYGVDFPMMGKVRVKGDGAHPFFQWVRREAGYFARPHWNFYKYLVNSRGELQDWFMSATKPDSEKVKGAIEKALGG